MIYAGFFRRFAATIIDAIIVALPLLIFGTTFLVLPIGLFSGVISGIFYKSVFESSEMAATPGKALMGISVLSESGQTLTFKKAVLRFFCSYLSGALLGIGYLMQPFTSKRQALHDMLSEAIVIRKETPDFNYFVIWRNQIKIIFANL